MTRESRGSGAYWGLSWMTTSELPVRGLASIDFTFPTGTPEIRTSASCASWPASLNGTVNR